jgi:hypothetical protein
MEVIKPIKDKPKSRGLGVGTDGNLLWGHDKNQEEIGSG